MEIAPAAEAVPHPEKPTPPPEESPKETLMKRLPKSIGPGKDVSKKGIQEKEKTETISESAN